MRKKILFFLILFISFSGIIFSQKPLNDAQKEFTYKINGENGTNASAVVWEPKKKLYFTIIAGNKEYPFEAFDSKGTSVYSKEVGIDSRGMWYNKSKKRLEINGAGDNGWYAIILKKDMTSHTLSSIQSGQKQPDFNSVGTYNDKQKEVVFYNDNTQSIELYKYSNPESKREIFLEILTGKKSSYNYTSIGFTGKKGYEYVLLNYKDLKLVYFNTEGKESGSTNLPENAIVNERFRFSYTNDRVFLYDVDTRVWTSYKVF